jgi:ubiquinone/menaquinone biosynthesis C-methylase UbiE
MSNRNFLEISNENLQLIKKHYLIEKKLAHKLKNSSKIERKSLYKEIYNELYTKIPYHSQLLRKKEEIKIRQEHVKDQMRLLNNFLESSTNFLEIGPGDCALSFEVSKYVSKVFAIDVSDIITKNRTIPQNFILIITDGSEINIPENTINVSYSHQLIEHLHPEDAIVQLKGIYRCLTNGGKYICITPHRFKGPSDISKYFDDSPKGLHLKEYTNCELYRLCKQIGFTKIQYILRVKGKHFRIPILPTLLVELFLIRFKYRIRKRMAQWPIIKNILPIRIIAIK